MLGRDISFQLNDVMAGIKFHFVIVSELSFGRKDFIFSRWRNIKNIEMLPRAVKVVSCGCKEHWLILKKCIKYLIFHLILISAASKKKINTQKSRLYRYLKKISAFFRLNKRLVIDKKCHFLIGR